MTSTQLNLKPRRVTMGKIRTTLFALAAGVMMLTLIGITAHDVLTPSYGPVRLLAADPPGTPPPPPLPRA